jgi:hypothetical protein
VTLRVTVEIVPCGDESRKRVLDVMNIENITHNLCWENEYGEVSDYRVRGHRRSAGFWELIKRVLGEHCGRVGR